MHIWVQIVLCYAITVLFEVLSFKFDYASLVLVLLVLLAMRLMPGGIGWCLMAEDRSEALHVMSNAVVCCEHQKQVVVELTDDSCCQSVEQTDVTDQLSEQDDICCLSLDDDGQDQLPSHVHQAVAAAQFQILPPWRVAR